jgi:Na+/H+ antiporter NhaD/arsenite permease-like protein
MTLPAHSSPARLHYCFALATMLVPTTARKKGEEIRGLDFFKVGTIVTPLTLLAAAVALWLTFLVKD